MRGIPVLLFGPLAAAAISTHKFSIGNWKGALDASSGVLYSFSPTSDASYNFSPTDYFHLRNGVGNYHTGDLTMSWRLQNSTAGEWQEVDSATSRDTAPKNSAPSGSILQSDFSNVFPAAAKYLDITRNWQSRDGDLILSFTVANKKSSPVVELGAFGLPIEFNNIFTNRTAEETHVLCNLVDPYIGLHGGYAQVTRLTGTGPNMVIQPATNATKFEAWNFLYENPDQPCYYQSQVFEGLYSWQTLTTALAETVWNATDPWMTPTSQILEPGESVTYALRFSVAPDVSDIEGVVASNGVPVAVGIPGYIVPEGMDTYLYTLYDKAITSMTVVPEGSLSFTHATIPNTTWKAFSVGRGSNSSAFGRARLTIDYADGKSQAISYYLTKSGIETMANFGEFAFTEQWFTEDDPYFHRSPSIISYDYGTRSQITQEYRAWIAGISDEAGAGSFEAAAMKTSVYPVQSQVHQLEEMVQKTVFKWLQNAAANGSANPTYSVKRSLFFYEPSLLPPNYYNSSIDFDGTWSQPNSWSTWRAYDYVHVSALYWGLYSAEQQSPGMLHLQNSTWYLLKAYETVMEVFADYNGKHAVTYYGMDGLMCETVWQYILEALKAEGYTSQFTKMQAAMKHREKHWSRIQVPYGSEMAWDSTGEEGVYLWAKYFGNEALVTKTINAVRGYMPTVPHWGWNGNARRYWDFLYGGSIARIERMIHHYGSGLNALPMLDNYKYNTAPSSIEAIYNLRVGYGGNMGPMSNINEEGFGHEAFHSYPDTMIWEAYSADYGQNFLGHVLGACTFLVDHPDFGMVSFGGNIAKQSGSSVSVKPMDSVRQRIYVAPAGLAVQINAGMISSFTYDSSAKTVTVSLAKAAGQSAKTASMTWEDTINTGISFKTSSKPNAAGGYPVDLPSVLTFKM